MGKFSRGRGRRTRIYRSDGILSTAAQKSLCGAHSASRGHRGRGKENREMENTKITTTIRVPLSNIEAIQKESDEMGLSLNSYMLLAIHMGRKILNSNISVCQHIPE
jgi:hypothetical protein